MTIENGIKRLLDSDKDISYSQRVAIADLLESLKCCGNCKPKDKCMKSDHYSINICNYWTSKVMGGEG